MKRKTRVFRRLNMFYTLLLSTILPCVLATLLLGLVFVPMMHGVTSTTDEAYEDVILSAACAQMESVLEMLEDIRRDFQNTKWLHDLYFVHLMGNKLTFETKEDIILDLGRMVAENPELYSVAFQFYDDPTTIYSSAGIFEDINVLQEFSPDSVYYQFFEADADQAGFKTIEYGGKNYLLWYTPFSHISGGRMKGVVNVLLRNETIGKNLVASSEGHGQSFCLLDKNENVLWTYDVHNKIYDSVELIRSLRDPQYALAMEIPNHISTQTRSRVMPMIFLSLALSLLVSAVVSYLLSRFTYQPIQKITRRFIQKHETAGNELLALEQVFVNVLDEKSVTEDMLSHLRPIAKQQILSGLMDGTAFLEDNVEEQLRYCHICFEHGCYNVISATMPFAQSTTEAYHTELAIETLTEHLCHQVPLNAYIFCKDTDNFRIIVNYDSWDNMQTFLSLLMTQCKDYFRKHELDHLVFLGVGQMVESLEELYHCTEQADTAVNVAALNRLEQPMFYNEVAGELNYEYFYPFSDELLLSRAISNCDTVSAKALLNTIIEENKKNSKLAPKCLDLLYMDIYSTLSRSGRSLGITIPPAEVNENVVALDDLQKKLEALIDEICLQIGARRSKTVRPAEQKILFYIEEHLFDSNLSLSSIADAFGMSNAYISALIKAHYETNFLNYINQARILKAIQLMTEKGLDANTVYPMVGYTNISTFRRNFSKYANCSMDQEEFLKD